MDYRSWYTCQCCISCSLIVFTHSPRNRVNGVVHVTPNNVPSEAKVQELVRSALEKDGKAPPEKSFSVSTVSLDPHEQAVMSISRAVSVTKTSQSPVSNLEPPSGVIGFKKQVPLITRV